jgi:DNA repair ATPase RecN
MIKNPTHLQKVYFLEEDQIKSGQITYTFEGDKKNLPAVEISNWYHRFINQIYKTKEEAQNALPKEISKTLKTLNKRIQKLSKKREKLASKLAKLLK